MQALAFGQGGPPEGLGLLLHHIGKDHFQRWGQGLSLFHPEEVDQVLGQPGQPPHKEKEFLDALRCRNGNLELSLSYQESNITQM